MRVLLLAPHPFYQERGTPIAVELLLRQLSADGHEVDVVTYHEGTDVEHPGVELDRIRPRPRVRDVPPGFSWKKLLCDAWLFARAWKRAGAGSYDRVHAVEESVFVALALRWARGLPYVYDMDSSLSQQVVDKHGVLRPLRPAMEALEGLAVRRADAVVAVCGNLAERARAHGARRVEVLRDVALADALPADPSGEPGTISEAIPEEISGEPGQVSGESAGKSRRITDLREELGAGDTLLLYVGNLEFYQGIDLLLEAMARLPARARSAPEGEEAVSVAPRLAIIGGSDEHVARYRRRVEALGLGERVTLLGPRPVRDLEAYLEQADVLVSPRLAGDNTPMKLYSYLRSGKPVVATSLPSHTEVLDDEHGVLVQPEPEALAAGLARLLSDPGLRRRLGEAGRRLYDERFGPARYREVLRRVYPPAEG